MTNYCHGYGFDSRNFLSSAIATWYGAPEGAGSTGGACGLGDAVDNPPYNSLITAGGSSLFQSGNGCGACYQVKCTGHAACSGQPVTVTITDSCPGCDGAVHFDLSGRAFGFMAKPGEADALRTAGKISVEYQRVPCEYHANIILKIDPGSNSYYLAFEIENVNGDGDIGYVELRAAGWSGWVPMQRTWGVTWHIQLPDGAQGPYSVRLTTVETKETVVAADAIPAAWSPARSYYTGVNFQ
ncbi:beta expansin 1 [Genlisea aurea]|uniref:Beta expansin 1 n=1 Tax=Genlisea aurea TaxID=192259 RepID=S8CTQ5_9LAMI|nr:beta expansin 1 [Genlisea aurea]